MKVFKEQEAKGTFPQPLLDEMKGLVDGVHSINDPKHSQVTLNKIITLNYGFDLITAYAFSQALVPKAIEVAKEMGTHHLLRETFKKGKWMIEPAHCDAIGVRKSFTKSGDGAYFGRAYQFQTAGIFQDLISQIIYKSSDFKHNVVSVTAPGFVGSFAGMNDVGVAMGVDTIRSPNANVKDIGMNSLLMIRSVLQKTSDLYSSIEFITSTQRGAPFIYPLCDGEGDCAVIEAGAYLANGVEENPLQYVKKKLIKEGLVPSQQFLDQHKTNTFRNGLYIRFMNYSYPNEYLQFNEGLFKSVNYPYDPNDFKVGEFLFKNYTADNDAAKIVHNDYFYPQKEEEDDFVVVTNFAFVPEDRLTMMNGIDNFFAATTAEAPTWRYDQLMNLTLNKKGKIDFDEAIWLMSFLSPERAPGYWNNTIIPNNPMSAIVEGSISVYDLKKKVMKSKGGYWADNWIQTSLPLYL